MKLLKFCFILSLVFLTACSSFFPDKEKDYLLSKEVLPLDMPPDVHEEEYFAQLDPILVPADLVKTVELIDDGSGVTYLRVNTPLAHVWRVVAKALTVSAVEITDKNRSTASYFVLYDPELQAVADGSFMDELVFFFGDDPNQEQPYQIYLLQSDQGTEIYVRDDTSETVENSNSTQLLAVLYKAIQEDFKE